MPYFHVTAVFEGRGASLEEVDRAAAALFKTLRHPRVAYYEHDTSGGLGPYPPAKSLYFSVIADFDVEAGSEERAVDIAEDVLDALSSEEIQYWGHGIVFGAQRVQPEQRSSREEERHPRRETRAEREGTEEDRKGKRRRSRGRGRKRAEEPEAEEAATEQSAEEVQVHPLAEERAEIATETPPPIVQAVPEPREETRAAHTESEFLEVGPETAGGETPLPPPRRSSVSMRVTLTVNLRASELVRPGNGTSMPAKEELVVMAIAEARRRHPELPADVAPEASLSALPGGDTLLALTWHYDTPVPSATEAA
jgi:hypothetical protein